jgi:hypothetical protein
MNAFIKAQEGLTCHRGEQEKEQQQQQHRSKE